VPLVVGIYADIIVNVNSSALKIFWRYEKIYKENIKKIYLHNLTTLCIVDLYINIYHIRH